MGSQAGLHIWSMRALYAAMCCAFLMFHLLPVASPDGLIFAPDFILCLTLAWAARRPEYTPILLIALTGLLADLLLSRPPGLWAALTLLLSEYIRNRGHRMRNLGFVWEWFRVSAGIMVIFLADRIALSIILFDTPPFTLSLLQVAQTVLVYPVIVGFSAFVLRVRHLEAGEVSGDRIRA